MKIQNRLALGTIDRDSDERFVANGRLVDSQNFSVTTTEGNNQGVGKLIPGNILKSNYGIVGAKTIGEGANPAENKIYNFIKGTNHDYIIEYDTETELSVIVLQSSIGGVLNFDANKRITNFNIFIDADGNGNLMAWCGDDNPPRLANIEAAKTWGIDGFSNDEISVMKPSPIFAPTTVLTTSTDGVENNFIEDKFITFATRYKYRDGFYSAPSSWSRVAFEPKQFSLDYQTYENNGMLNLSNAVNVSFNVGPREVIQVDILFRQSNSPNIYVAEEFIKEDEGWANSSTQSFQFSKAKIYKVLPEEQFFRNFDNVPLQAFVQATFGNRLGYANFLEGRDIDTDIDFDVTVVSLPAIQDEIEGVIINDVKTEIYDNAIDFSEGTLDGGSNPADQMNYVTNTVEMDLSIGSGAALNGNFSIKVNPEAGYMGVLYNITFKEGTTTLASYTGLTGNETKTYASGSDKDVKVYVTSDEGLIYSSNLTYRVEGTLGLFSRYIYECEQQLSFPNSVAFPATLLGDTVIEIVSEIDMSGFAFTSGKQIRINFELKSSLVNNFNPSGTFFYNLTRDYVNLNDFLTNPESSFVQQLEEVFSLTFRNTQISNLGPTVVDYVGFKVYSFGSNLIITTPNVTYTVIEPNGNVDKIEFYLINEVNLQTTTSDAFTSLHSDRDYEVVQIYLDEQGRKTTGLNSVNNTVYIPADKSDEVNKLEITLNHTPPSWAKYYKFAIKQVERDYETIYGNVVFKEGLFRYIQLVGENKGKVKEGDLLIVKSDYSGPLESLQKVKVLEVKDQEANFITGNLISTNNEIIEPAGVYMKIKQGDFNINIDQNTYQTYRGFGVYKMGFVPTEPIFGFIDDTNTLVLTEVKAGTQIRFFVEVNRSLDSSITKTYEFKTTSQDDYASVKDWWDAEIEILDSWQNYASQYLDSYDWGSTSDGSVFRVKAIGGFFRKTIIEFDVNFSGGTLVFETSPILQLTSSFFETPETYNIIGGNHEFTDHVLEQGFNCFSFGNGVESYRIQDTLTGASFSIDANPTAINPEGYKQRRGFADITYSGIFNSNTNVNKLNEFNLSLANFKDDIIKAYGPIVKMQGFETNLEIIQADKYSIVYYGKDLLYNADGTTNLSRIEEVLGQQDTLNGEFGISNNIDSFDFYGFDRYFSDIRRGVVLKKSNNGLFEISNQGMRDYFRKLFRDNTINQIIGCYDQFYNYYILNVKYNDTEYVTWTYSDANDGWTMRQTFNPEGMIRCNNKLFSFKNGEVYEHNQPGVAGDNFNKFYGVSYPSKFAFFFSQEPSMRKNFKNIEIEGTDAWQITLQTDLNDGFINKESFEKKEGVWYSYVRTSNSAIDTSLLANQGIGECAISGLTLTFTENLDNFVAVGDQIRNVNSQLVGVVQSLTENTITLDTVNNITSGAFVMCSKIQSIANNDLLGYYMKVEGELQKNSYSELYAINSEIAKSFM